MNLFKEAKFQLSQINKLNGYLNAFIRLNKESYIFERLNESCKRYSEGRALSSLDGKLVAIKDNICTKDLHTTCSSYMLKDYISPYEATVITKLREAGAIIIGKTNMDEFSIGVSTSNQLFGSTLNPMDLKMPRSPGGSSGGSAAAVSSDMCYIALGTDTGGSVRQPASYCNCIGFKPSYGLISRWGVVTYSNSLDTVGILGKSIKRIRETFNILNIYDPNDPTSLPAHERLKIKQFNKNKQITIGIPLDFNISEISQNSRDIWKKAIKYLESKGFNITTVRLPNIKYSPMIYNIITSVEASSNLAKYNGLVYGHSANIDTNENIFQKTRDEGFGDQVKKKILIGTYFSIHNNYFKRAQKIRRLILNDFNNVFNSFKKYSKTKQENKVDILITPTTIGSAPLIENTPKEISLLDLYLSDFFTISANLSGIPAISIPFSYDQNGLPIGIQLMAQYGCDDLLLDVAEVFELKSL
ncbi:aspartyl/glutamyl-tRNA(Asn/Gln) amidotransferase, A subunit [Pneumocystis carinii B80]|uniref:Glutamyl-tRNA(Gln) amidotransferase subunit A, mitochondrial n=1 Tax=Pneumocystis carinii (strain B80) TaxID=1408658 RepID=A0A0W4ZR03_PNEC8|nr:aspartyl/glutamyl-tRNA(Asn/Gln) amidotransferase, A subunit [Pneumocystis carinii B80]KTW30804.1 aspartyl/glutamyl-tRNA(Asn/Gln) amidotransferase, A subunit [Pneumocystis carinii B80]